MQITAPIASPEQPLEIEFLYDATLVPTFVELATVRIHRNGVVVSDCARTFPAIVPNPCVVSRSRVAGDDVEVRVKTSAASQWGGGAVVGGDGRIGGPEEYDDGNQTIGDGCSADCTVDHCFTCRGVPSFCTPPRRSGRRHDVRRPRPCTSVSGVHPQLGAVDRTFLAPPTPTRRSTAVALGNAGSAAAGHCAKTSFEAGECALNANGNQSTCER